MYSGYPVVDMGQLKCLCWGRPGMFDKLTVTVIALSMLQGDIPGTSGFYLIFFFFFGRLGFSSESVSKEQRREFGKNAIYEF